MNIDYEMTLSDVSVIAQQDTFTDVVKRVVWLVDFFDTSQPTIKSTGNVETYLNTDAVSADTFSPFENLTQTQILQWAFDAEGGTAFLDQLLEGGHAAHVEKLVVDGSYIVKSVTEISET